MCTRIAATASTTSGSSRSKPRNFCPPLNISDDIRYPVLGAALQRRGGTARHDAVAWGYARAADALGVDIIENCEVTGIRRDAERRGRGARDESRADPHAQGRRVGAGNTSVVMAHGRRAPAARELSAAGAGVRAGQAGFPCVVMSNTIHAYISQSDKGELVIGAGTDAYTSYTQRGALHINTHTLDAICELFPNFRRCA
jgi:sarcosine oxidase, subunit beta